MNCLKFVAYLAVAIAFSVTKADPTEDLFKGIEIDAPHLVTQALKAGVDPNRRDAKGQVPLFLALRGESLRAAEALLASPKIDIDASNDHGETPLMMAALRGQLTMVEQLLARGAKVNREGWTPLHYAASGPSVAVLTLLLDRGAAIDARSPNGTTPLMMAARYGSIEGADLLLARGSDRTLVNDKQLTAGDFADAAGREALSQRIRAR